MDHEDNVDKTNNDDPNKNIRNKMLIGLAVLCLVAVGYWMSLGKPSLKQVFDSEYSEWNCESLAEEYIAEGKRFWSEIDRVTVGKTWLKKGHRVVQIFVYKTDSDEELETFCVHGNGRVSFIPASQRHGWM